MKNILKYSEDENINEIFENFIDDHFMKILKTKSESIEFVKEIEPPDTIEPEATASESIIFPLLTLLLPKYSL